MASAIRHALERDFGSGEGKDCAAVTSAIARLATLKTDPETEVRLAWTLTDWIVRVQTPTWLRPVPRLVPHADALSRLDPVVAGQTAAAEAAVAAALAAAHGAAFECIRSAAADPLGPTPLDHYWATCWTYHGTGTGGPNAQRAAGELMWADSWTTAGTAAWTAAAEIPIARGVDDHRVAQNATELARAGAWHLALSAAQDATWGTDWSQPLEDARKVLRPMVVKMRREIVALVDRIMGK